VKPWARPILPVVICCLAFSAAYFAARQASGQEGPVEEATPTAVSTPDSESTAPPVETPPAGHSPSSIAELGESATGGTVYEGWGVRLQLPAGSGDFRVIYPVIVENGQGDGTATQRPDIVMTVYNIQTGSSLFLQLQDTPDGPRPEERGRYVEKEEANSMLDAIISTMEVAQ